MAKVIKRIWTTGQGEQKEAWIVRYYVNGKQHITTCRTKKEAEAERNRIGSEIDKRTHVAPSQSITVAEAVDRWLVASTAAGLEPTTIEYYRVHAEKHIKPTIGTMKLAELTSASVNDFAKTLR